MRTRPALCGVIAAVALTGCATAPIVAPTPAPTSAIAAPSPSPTATPSPVRSVTPAGSTSGVASQPAKKLATVKLPTQVADRRADRVTESAGGQTASYYKPMDTANVIVAAVSPIGTATDAVSRLADAKPSGPGWCGGLSIAGKQTAACVVPLDPGYLLVNGAGTQTVAEVAQFTAALHAMLP